MKKLSLVLAAALFVSSVTFAQTTAPAKKQEPVKTEKKEVKKGEKKGGAKKGGAKKETGDAKKAK